jgi:hypothetical protein
MGNNASSGIFWRISNAMRVPCGYVAIECKNYRIPKGLNLRDEIGRYWRIAQAHWADFKSGREAKADPRVVADRFVLALLRDSVGFTSLAPAPPAILQERTYPIGHRARATPRRHIRSRLHHRGR